MTFLANIEPQAMMERIASSPEAFASACLIWIPVAIWVVSLIHWMITGDVETIQGLLGVVVALIVGVVALNPPNPNVAPLLFVAALATLLLAPAIRLASNKSILNSIEIEAMERAYEVLAQKPDNMGAKIKLARAAYNKGLRAHAIVLADDALKGQPERLLHEEFRMLRGWKAAEAELMRNSTDPGAARIRCVECGIPNYPGTIFCSRCGAPFLLDYASGRFVKSGLVKRVVYGWLAAMIALVGIPTAATSLPLLPAIVVILGLSAFGIWMLVNALRETAPAK